VHAPLAARHPLEVLDRVGDVDLVARQPGRLHHLVEQPPGRTHEGPSGHVLLVARLLAHHHDARVHLSLAEDGLGRALMERTAATAVGGLAERCQGPSLGQELGGRHGLLPVRPLPVS
jgi:hypothetical protein